MKRAEQGRAERQAGRQAGRAATGPQFNSVQSSLNLNPPDMNAIIQRELENIKSPGRAGGFGELPSS